MGCECEGDGNAGVGDVGRYGCSESGMSIYVFDVGREDWVLPIHWEQGDFGTCVYVWVAAVWVGTWVKVWDSGVMSLYSFV